LAKGGRKILASRWIKMDMERETVVGNWEVGIEFVLGFVEELFGLLT
jgi:hypothetical protein